LDASALLALLNDEPGASVVAETIPGAIISAVNLSEVVAKLSDVGVPENVIREALGGLGLQVDDLGTALAFDAGLLRPTTRAHGLSLGDRCCLALAARLEMPALTADRAWAEADLVAEVVLIR